MSLKNPNSSITLIEASAGSGKTFRLTQRYIELLLKGNDISSILAITFTDNAAKEMKERIIKALKEIYFNPDDTKKRFTDGDRISSLKNNELCEKVDKIVNEIFRRYSQFNVKTIDSFITSIFSLSSFEFDYPTNFSIRFDYKSAVKDKIVKFLAERILKEQTEKIDRFLKVLNEVERNSLFDPTDRIVSHLSEFFEKEDDFIAEIKRYQEKEKNDALKRLEEITQPILAKAKNIAERYPVYSEILEGIKNKDGYTIAKKTVSDDEGSIVHQRYRHQLNQEEKLLSQDLLSLSKEYLKLNAELFYLPYLELYFDFKDEFEKMQKESQDIILSSLPRIINSRLKEFIPELYIRLSSILTHFLIDEFQDTSHAQWSVIRPFIEEALSREGTGFLIGDIKQAIYMFRNADYKIMMDMIKNPKNTKYLDTSTLPEGIKVETIAENYRSSQIILDYVNEICEKFADHLESEGIQDFKEIYSVEHKAANEKKGYVKTVKISEGKIKEEFLKIIDDVIARVPFSSIAVLSYKNETLDEIASWLGGRGIPVISYGRLDIRNNTTIQGIINLLRFLNNPEDEFSFTMSVLSPFFIKKLKDISRDDIEKCFISHNISTTQKISKIGVFKEHFGNIWDEFLKPLIEESSKRDVYSLIGLILSKFDIAESFPQDNAYILRLLDLVSELIKDEGIYSLADFIDVIETASQDDERFWAEISPDIDAVKLMTFHKAKGLEFDVVINIFKDNHRSGPKIYYDVKEDGIRIYRLNEAISKTEDNTLQKIYLSDKRDEKIAEINATYVALTRAKSELYNIVEGRESEEKENKKPTHILDLLNEREMGEKIRIEKREDKISEFVADIKKTSDVEELIDPQVFNDTQEIVEGKIFHRALSFFFSDNIEPEKAVDLAIDYEDVLVEKNRKDDILNLLKKTLDDKKLMALISDNSLVKSEFEFADEKANIMRADLVVIENDRIKIVDFKTGTYKEEDEKQINTYISSLRKIYPSKKVEGFLYYVKTGELKIYS